MKILSVNVGQPRPINVGGREVLTGIYKDPILGRVEVRGHNLAGDAQADLTVHGGEHKAVYAYPFEHYPYWESALKRSGFVPGIFGENLTTTGLLEEIVCVGDVLQIGSAVLQVTQPRTPCFKLAHKFGRPQFVKEFLLSGRSGFYLRIVKEGTVAAGDEVTVLEKDPNGVTVRELLGLVSLNEINRELAARAVRIEALPRSWRADLEALLET